MCRIRAIFVLAILAFLPAAGRTQTIPDQIDAILARSTVVGNTWTVLVENVDGSVIYYQRSPTTGQAPASNTKIYTTSAAFGLLGTNYAFETRVYREGTLTGGVLTGNLNLVSEHDMTWNTTVFFSAPGPVDSLPLLPGNLVEAVTCPTPVMVGEFKHANGDAYVMVVNLSLERSAKFTLTTRQPYDSIKIVSAVDGSLSAFDQKDDLWLVAGQGALLALGTHQVSR